VLAAPTGRAAKRLAELAGHDAATIHRLLELRPGGDPSFDADTPLDADLVVIDETSMVDVILANKLVKAVPPGAHLLLVGDVDQLPSVGAGEVLRDLLAAGSLPAVRLTKIFRQAQQSGIVINAHRVNAGQQPQLTGFGDFFWFGCDDTEQTAALVTDIVARRIPARFGLDPRRDVQVLCPMHRGPAGAGNLNQLLQEALTPSRDGAPERRYGGRVFRIGDKVAQLRNNYDKGAAGVFNGTVGVITVMSPEEHTLTVRTDEDEHVDYGFDELDELAHAYAVTIHRSQGSEYPAVVIPLTTSSWMMLQRNLLYTGVTRARRLVVLAGSRRALAAAVRTRGAGRRHTALAHRLHPHPSALSERVQHRAGPALQRACRRHLCHADEAHLDGKLLAGHTPKSDSAEMRALAIRILMQRLAYSSVIMHTDVLLCASVNVATDVLQCAEYPGSSAGQSAADAARPAGSPGASGHAHVAPRFCQRGHLLWYAGTCAVTYAPSPTSNPEPRTDRMRGSSLSAGRRRHASAAVFFPHRKA
jgi:hypothetical protein